MLRLRDTTPTLPGFDYVVRRVERTSMFFLDERGAAYEAVALAVETSEGDPLMTCGIIRRDRMPLRLPSMYTSRPIRAGEAFSGAMGDEVEFVPRPADVVAMRRVRGDDA